MSCETCPNFNKEFEECNRPIYKITDDYCFKKNICWLLIMLLDALENPNSDGENGEGWKEGKSPINN